MVGYVDNIEELTLKNTNFREVMFTGSHSQLVVMCLKPGEDIGEEVHNNVDQFFRVEAGVGKIVMNGEETEVKDGSAIVVPAGTKHNLINTSATEDLKLYTIYSPANHPVGTKHVTRADAMAAEAEHHH
ncbi:MAG TPA: cupin domain-containing protein [Candidatus Dojkabacteria bacterium]|mgnify:CR=1 FL=1|nr:cupin domain-containing protein [Candidatus Dojkabacteria bacterium]